MRVYPSCERQAEKFGILSLKKGRLQGYTVKIFQYLKGAYRKLERANSRGTVVTGQRGMGSNMGSQE